VILLAEHDEPTTLAAKKKRQHGALSWPTSTPKNRVWGFEKSPSGRSVVEPQLSWETATGSVQYTYRNASGRAEWLSRDPIAEEGGINLYGYVANDPVDYYDPDGLTAAAAGAVLAGGGVLVLGEEGGTLGLGTPVAILTGLGVLGLAGYELLQPGATPSSCEAKQTQPQVIPKGNNGKRAQATAAAAAAPPPPPDPGHNKNARKSTENKHQEGDSRRQADQGGEKGDARRD
jgi:RHS repeat-associated protein